MSDGPIRREREAWKPLEVSTPDARRVCMRAEGGRGYCGRSTKAQVTDWDEVSCTDCRAAARADGVRISLLMEVRKVGAA